ncbi:ABC transporter permease [Clostridium estertheticum]|uniref:ABC transporter permease n=1 Tax=Clostridium estertheticum TaxID=238834 RepID=UPI001C7CB05F|nr:ABC transporter permease [Clostridium estertheticum]MBX4259439.1 ABC transporter permease [Clostridium estertheticum]WLC70742.1 ABC transporter permease [Clostridium estertheticum]
MRKINALIKYEIINLKRGKLIWVIAALYAFGIQQTISSMNSGDGIFLSVVGVIKVSWLPLNLIMVPILLLCMKIGQSHNDIFEIIDISHRKIMLSKILTLSIIEGFVLILNIIILVVFGVICKVSIGYFLYQSVGYIINTIVFLMVCTCVGLFIGQTISKYLGEVIGFIFVILVFLILCNFYKTSNIIVPLINIRIIPGVFDVISYDKSYLYHNILWLMISFGLLILPYDYKYRKKENRKNTLFQMGVLALSIILCIYLGRSIYLMRPSYYNITSRNEDILAKYSDNKDGTFFGEKKCGYYIDKYNMNLDITNKLKNDCEMEIKINKSGVNSLELGLYEKLDIAKIEVRGKEMKFKRTNHSFIVTLPRKYTNNEIINMKVSYEGEINTSWVQGQKSFYVRNNSFFLADVFEWYPKLNDDTDKEYNINIKYAGKNKIYSNLNEKSKSNQYEFQGKDRDVVLISGNISDRTYKGYLFIGNEEYINNNNKCNDLIDFLKTKNNPINRILLSPFIPQNKMDKPYEKMFLYSVD